jgi:glutathione S-transferase
MKLYIVPGSNNARKCQAVASHLGLEPEIIRLDFFTGDLKQPDFLAINPNGKVPALVDGERTLWESEAINMYFCTAKVEETSLFAPADRPEIMQWLFWSVSHFNNNLGGVVWEAVAKPHFMQLPTNEPVLERQMELFHQHAKVLNDHLDGRTFMVGDDWTLADYSIGHIESFVDMLPVEMKQYKNIYAFYERLRENDHWMASAVPMDKLGRAA